VACKDGRGGFITEFVIAARKGDSDAYIGKGSRTFEEMTVGYIGSLVNEICGFSYCGISGLELLVNASRKAEVVGMEEEEAEEVIENADEVESEMLELLGLDEDFPEVSNCFSFDDEMDDF
jgi:hypothetical protein